MLAQYYEMYYLYRMKAALHEEIVISKDVTLMNSPAFYDCCLHLICNRGCVGFNYNGKPFQLKRDDIAVISRPRLVTDIKVEDEEDFDAEYLAAPDKFLHNLLPANNYAIQGCVSLFDNPVMTVSKEDADRFRRDVSNIKERVKDSGHRFYQEMIGGLLQTMIYDLFDFHVKDNESILTTDRVGYITTQFFTLLEAGKPRTEREVSYYADHLNVTPKYLSDTIKRVTGLSVSAHINRAAAAIIIEQLKDNKLSITQIADQMNFTSVSYFSRYCTKHIGVSPARYRLAGDKSSR